MGVYIGGGTHLCMTQPPGDNYKGRTVCNHEGGISVPETVDVDT